MAILFATSRSLVLTNARILTDLIHDTKIKSSGLSTMIRHIVNCWMEFCSEHCLENCLENGSLNDSYHKVTVIPTNHVWKSHSCDPELSEATLTEQKMLQDITLGFLVDSLVYQSKFFSILLVFAHFHSFSGIMEN